VSLPMLPNPCRFCEQHPADSITVRTKSKACSCFSLGAEMQLLTGAFFFRGSEHEGWDMSDLSAEHKSTSMLYNAAYSHKAPPASDDAPDDVAHTRPAVAMHASPASSDITPIVAPEATSETTRTSNGVVLDMEVEIAARRKTHKEHSRDLSASSNMFPTHAAHKHAPTPDNLPQFTGIKANACETEEAKHAAYTYMPSSVQAATTADAYTGMHDSDGAAAGSAATRGSITAGTCSAVFSKLSLDIDSFRLVVLSYTLSSE
jgi:hypothetical protein